MKYSDFGYLPSQRDAAIKDAKIIGIITSAAVHDVSLTALYKWLEEEKDEVR